MDIIEAFAAKNKCIRDDSNGQGTILQYLPSQLVGIYFEEAE